MSFAGGVEYCRNNLLNNTLPEFANNPPKLATVLIHNSSVWKKSSELGGGVMAKAFMPCVYEFR